MTRATRFAARDPGPAARVAGFMAHLRLNGLRLGPGETETALAALACLDRLDPERCRRALKAVCVGCAEDAGRFDALFDAYWLNAGRVRDRVAPKPAQAPRRGWRGAVADHARNADGAGAPDAPDGEGEAAGVGTGRLVAARAAAQDRRDLRDLVSAEDARAAERIARRLGAALRDRRSRRRRAARRGAGLDFRRLIRRSLATGGEPLTLPRRRRPDRPVRVVALCDVSGSMGVYARPFLAFLAGLIRADAAADAYVFHTRLVRVAEALRELDPMRALDRLSLMSEGFGGGSKIGDALEAFARGHARRAVDGRTVVLILSDGYDSGPPERLAAALARLRRRGGKLVWLNPLKGWRGYAPVAAGMAAAAPHLDAFLPAATLADLAALEPHLARL